MSLIIKRSVKGSPLTSSEVDANVNNLNNDKVEIANSIFTGTPSLVDNLIPLSGTVLPAIYPTLNLDFANSQTLDPRITFARSSTATYTDKTTVLAEQNLLTYSQDFRNTADAGSTRPWQNSNTVTTSNTTTAPDGTSTASTNATGTSANNYHFFYQELSGVANNTYTATVYAKVNTGTYLNVTLFDAGVPGTSYAACIFNVATGTLASTGQSGANYSVIGTPAITLIGNGWYRCSLTCFIGVASVPRFSVQTSEATTISIFGLNATYTGTNKSLYIWGAQLEQRAFASTYLPTTSSAITNYAPALKLAPANIPRFDFDPINRKCLGLLIEEGRTNLLVNSTIDGANLATQNITTTAAARTLSFYGSGTVTLSGTATATIVGLGAYPTRTTYTYAPTAGTLTVTVSGTVQYANDELGSFATSFMPTGGSSFSRVADTASMTGVNFSSWYNQSEGSVYAEFDLLSVKQVNMVPFAIDNITSQGYMLYQTTGIGSWRIYAGTNSTNLLDGTALSNTPYKVNISYGISISSSINGATPIAVATGGLSGIILNRLILGKTQNNLYQMCGHIKKLTYYPKALSSSELVGLTR
jgi:hypothetical protein